METDIDRLMRAAALEHARKYPPMELHPGCEHACQQAEDYGVWPEHSCRPVCARLAALRADQGGESNG